MKIAVIGAGIFGITIAVRLAKNHSVDLFEKNNDILMAASDVNQCRVHRGYHYPRSDDTVKEVLNANKSFMEEFGESVMNNTENYYCIAKHGSLVSGSQYVEFCKRNNLEFKISTPDVIDKNSIELCFKVDEKIFDHKKLKNLCLKKINKNNVNLFLNKEVDDEIFPLYDFVVLCTYGQNNKLLRKFPEHKKVYQFEVVEKIFFKLPESFKNMSILVMDGPFTGIDPVGDTEMHIIGDVEHTVHQRTIGSNPEIESRYIPLLNKGIITNPPVSKYNLFMESILRFMPEIKNAQYIGSSFGIKTTLPYVDKTDERPTLVRKINDKIVTVFSGKIPTCVEAAKEIEKIVNRLETHAKNKK